MMLLPKKDYPSIDCLIAGSYAGLVSDRLISQELQGNPCIASVVCGNGMAQIVGCILLPLCEWLSLPWLLEQPVTSLV